MKKLVLLLVAVCSSFILDAQQIAKYSPDYMKLAYTKTEVMIPMRDGVKLFTSIYEPKDKSVKHPVLMERTCYAVSPYGADNFMNFISYAQYVDAGYIFVFQDVRGKNMSEGEFEEIRAFIENKKWDRKHPEKNIGQTDEASDTYDTVEWIVNNTNNNGCVGQKGISYPGFYTTMAALSGHPALKAVSPQAPVTDWYMGDDVHHNGAFMLSEMVSFQPWFEYSMKNTNVKAGVRNFNFPDLMTSDIYSDYLRIGTYGNITAAYADSLHYLRTVREHPDLDEYWISHTVSKGHLHDVKPAVMVVGGLFDKEDCYGALDVYKTIKAESPATDLYIIEGPWYHGAWARGMRQFWANMYFGPEATSEYYNANFEYPFFAYYLEGKGEKPKEGATVFDSGSRQWKYYGHAWPEVSQEGTTPFYLHADGTISTSKPLSSGSVTYTSDPAHPVPYRSMIETSISKDYMIDDQRFASQRPDVLTFQTPELTEALTLKGEVSVDLQVALTSTDADFIVKIIDVFPQNFSWYDEIDINPSSPEARELSVPRYVMSGYQFMVRGEVMRGKYRESFSDPKPFTPGQTTEVHFTMPDVCHTFKPGHRLMIQIQSSWFPLVDRNPQTFCNIFTCDESAYVKEDITVFCSPSAASRVNLPVVKDADKETKVVILGDSYSTFEQLIPQGYACWYFSDPANDTQTGRDGSNDVHVASQTWWKILLQETGARLLLNSSYSGATISSTGYGRANYSDRSFVTRARTDIVGPDGRPGRCGETPDVVLIFGGTNDCWAHSPIGEVLPPSQWKNADLTQCMPSTSYLLGYLKENLPSSTRIVMIVNSELGEVFEKGFAKACELYGAECIQLHDIEKQLGHPSQVGMRAIAQQVKAAVLR